MIKNDEINKILEKLESLEDEEQAVKLLAEFNRASSELGKLLLNLDEKLSSVEWKSLCDNAQKRLDDVVKKINEL